MLTRVLKDLPRLPRVRLTGGGRGSSWYACRRHNSGSSNGDSSGWLRRQWVKYEEVNLRRPILVRGATGIVLYGIGDVVAQHVSGSCMADGGLDTDRIFRTCTWRAVIFTPLVHSFYIVLEVAVRMQGLKGALAKLVIDLLLLGPNVTASFFFYCKSLEAWDHKVGQDAVRQQLWPALIIGWGYWLPIHFCTYAMIPLRHRLLWVNFNSIWFGSVLSYMNASMSASPTAIVPPK